MLACLMAAMMSSADAYMIVTAGLVTRNVYAAYVDRDASEKAYVLVGRITGLLTIVGAAVVAVTMADVFGQFKFAVELPILFAAPFWLGMFWRRANRTAVWLTILFSLIVFFVLPPLLPKLVPGLRQNATFSAATHVVTKTSTRAATAADVARHEAWLQVATAAGQQNNESLLQQLGPEPPSAPVGETIEIVTTSGGRPIFWSGALTPVGETGPLSRPGWYRCLTEKVPQ